MQYTCNDDVELLLIGNKCDLEYCHDVSKEEGEQLAHSLDIPFMETSARTGYNIDEAFETLVRLILNRVSTNTICSGNLCVKFW